VISTGAGDLCTINAGATDRVVLRGISFHGANVGFNAINVVQVGSLYVEHCSIAEFTQAGVVMPNGGNLWVTDTDVRDCGRDGLDVEASGSTPADLVAHDSRFAKCQFHGVFLGTSHDANASARGWLSNCTASLCFDGIVVDILSSSPTNADLTLTNCRAFGNGTGLAALTGSPGKATLQIANCVVDKNSFGINVVSSGGGVASVIGTSPGTNLISGNGTDGTTSGSATLQ
jgi:hypothetical protein